MVGDEKQPAKRDEVVAGLIARGRVKLGIARLGSVVVSDDVFVVGAQRNRCARRPEACTQS